MAKQIVGPVERHFEKVVVGIAGVLLLGAVAQYLVTSPNKMDLGGGDAVSPTAVDAALASKAQEVSGRIRNGRSSVDIPEPLFDEFAKAVNPFTDSDLSNPWPIAAPIQPEVPIVDPPDIVLGVQRLATVLQMPKPAVTNGRSTIRVESDSDSDSDSVLVITNWATVSSLFDRASQAKQFSDTYGATNSDVFFAGVDIQRRTMKPDGSWDDGAWQDIRPWPVLEMEMIVPELTLQRIQGRSEIPQNLYNDLQGYFTELAEGLTQIEIIRPLFVKIVNGATWSFPQITDYKNVLIYDDELLYPDEASPYPGDRYKTGKSPEAKDTTIVVKLTPKELIQSGREKLQRAQTANDATRAYNDFFSVKRDPKATALERDEAIRWLRQAEQLIKDMNRKAQFGGQGGGKGSAQKPKKKKRERLPHQQLWAHDAIEGSIEAGLTYQYRIRAVLFNILAGEPGKFDDPSLSLTVLMEGPWSEPSEPVVIRDTVRYFVTSFNERRKQISVEFFQWWAGVWVKNRDVFAVGQKLAKKARANVPDIFDPTQADYTLVPFSADATVMEIDFKRSYRDRGRAASREGVAYGPPSEMCSAVLLDANGDLQERFIPIDKANPEKSVYAAKVWKAPRGK